MTVTVVVPTYKRPDYLERCVRSVFAQTRLPDEIILVSRDTDEPTNLKIASLQNELDKTIPILNPHVTEAGFLPPIKKGIEVANHDIVVFLDDDAEAFPNWLERIVTLYDNPDVGGVGGRCVTYYEGRLLTYPVADKASIITWYGEAIGNMYRDLTFAHPISATHLMGGNSSYRREVLQKVGIDSYLNKDVAFGWELELGLSILDLGYTLIFDPMIKINHFTAPRENVGMRPGHDNDSLFYMARNNTYTMRKHLQPAKLLPFFVYTFLIGRRSNLALLSFVVCFLISFDRRLFPKLTMTMKGKWVGWRDAACYQRERSSLTGGHEHA